MAKTIPNNGTAPDPAPVALATKGGAWASFRNLTIAELDDQIRSWEAGNDAAGAEALARDLLDNGVLRFSEGSVAERASDTLLAVFGPQFLPILGVRLARLVGAFLNSRPLSHLPF